MKSSSPDVKTQSWKLYGYNDIPLYVFMQIAESKDLNLLTIEGKPDAETLIESWEQIVKRNSEVNNSLEYARVVGGIRSYTKLILEYNLLKSASLALAIRDKDVGLSDRQKEILQYLRSKGHKVDTTSNEAYEESLVLLSKKADAITTRLRMKENELLIMVNDKGERSNFEETMATLCANLGFTVPDSVTLARYNEYMKVIKKKNAPKKQRQ